VVMAEPPLLAEAVQLTIELALAFEVPDTPVGTAARVAAVTLLDAADGLLVPTPFVAVTVNV
jgi:hypothetical protein